MVYYRLGGGVTIQAADDGREARVLGPGAPAADYDSAVLASGPLTPTADPIPPEAFVIVDDHAASTRDLLVTLTFAPYDDEGPEDTRAFDDITEMMISNDSSFAGAQWQPFAQGVPWQLDAEPGELARVHVHFRDDVGNETRGPSVAMILYDPFIAHLPLVLRER
jgi:hypothetical protein